MPSTKSRVPLPKLRQGRLAQQYPSPRLPVSPSPRLPGGAKASFVELVRVRQMKFHLADLVLRHNPFCTRHLTISKIEVRQLAGVTRAPLFSRILWRSSEPPESISDLPVGPLCASAQSSS